MCRAFLRLAGSVSTGLWTAPPPTFPRLCRSPKVPASGGGLDGHFSRVGGRIGSPDHEYGARDACHRNPARPASVALLAHHVDFRGVPAPFPCSNHRAESHTFPNVICAMGRRRVVKEQDQC